MTILLKKRVHFLLFVVGVIALSITAEKCRLWVGEEAASKSGQFTFLNCFDGSTGTLACVVKEGVKLYFYNIRSLHMESTRNQAIEAALADALAQGMAAKDAARVARMEGEKAAKLAKRKAKRIIGPIISSGWDFFEAMYYGGTVTEGFLRGTGTLFGTYYVGFIGEERFGRFGYLIGSHLGSWVGGRIGLMVYDVVNGIHYMMQSGDAQGYEDASNDNVFQPDGDENSLKADDSFMHTIFGSLFGEPSTIDTPSDESSNNETPPDEIPADEPTNNETPPSDEYSNSETPEDTSYYAHEDL